MMSALIKKSELWIAIALLVVSNIFMTFAWYGHLKFKMKPLWIVILASWGIAFLEYCFQVPANRIGSDVATAAQLKVIQEAITFFIFSIFSVMYLNQNLSTNDFLAFALIIGAVGLSLFQPF